MAAWRAGCRGGSDADEDNVRLVTRGWEGGSGPKVPTTLAPTTLPASPARLTSSSLLHTDHGTMYHPLSLLILDRMA